MSVRARGRQTFLLILFLSQLGGLGTCQEFEVQVEIGRFFRGWQRSWKFEPNFVLMVRGSGGRWFGGGSPLLLEAGEFGDVFFALAAEARPLDAQVIQLALVGEEGFGFD